MFMLSLSPSLLRCPLVVLLAATMTLLLAGCRLVSKQPLLDPSDGVQVFGQTFSAAGVDKEGRLAIDEKGETFIVEFELTARGYRGTNDGKTLLASFHKIRASPDLWLLQLVNEADGSAQYNLAKMVGYKLAIMPMAIDDKVSTAASFNGIKLETVSGDQAVASKVHLLELTRVWVETHWSRVHDDSKYELAMRVAKDIDGRQALQQEAADVACLLLAGHPQDSDVMGLPGGFGAGIATEKIEPGRALAACRAASSEAAAPSARFALARALYANGDVLTALDIATKLERGGYPLAFALRVEALKQGRVLTMDPAEIRKLLEAAVANGSAPAMVALAFDLFADANGGPGHARGLQLIKQAADKNFPPAMTLHANEVMRGNGVPKDTAAAIRLLEAAADYNEKTALNRLGEILDRGDLMPKDQERALKLFKRAAILGLPEAAYSAGFMLSRGQGAAVNAAEAVKLLKMAADAGSLAGKGEYGRMLFLGEGTSADQGRGLALIEEAAKAGDKNAASYLQEIMADRLPDPPSDYRGIVQDVKDGRSRSLGADELLFLGGVVHVLMQNCGLPASASDRAALLSFIKAANERAVMGADFSNRNLGQAFGNNMRGTAVFVAGTEFGERINCSMRATAALADGIVKIVRANERGSDGGASTFVKSCTPKFDETRCTCLANLGRAVIPNIHQSQYSRELVYQIIQGNPLLGLQMPFLCRINNY